jgi:hypothetical protein
MCDHVLDCDRVLQIRGMALSLLHLSRDGNYHEDEMIPVQGIVDACPVLDINKCRIVSSMELAANRSTVVTCVPQHYASGCVGGLDSIEKCFQAR